MAPGAVLEVARCRLAMWWRGSHQPSPVGKFFLTCHRYLSPGDTERQ
ncbi:hypothetical protein A2U01_0108578, partial [Trifolium medium]|nr:hypothetical protein [Trifolium medium]